MTVTDSPPGFEGVWRTDDEALAVYSESAGIARMFPRAIAVPADANDVVTLVKWASATETPLIPRGSGSSMCAGSIGDGVIVDLSRMRVLGKVDIARRRVHAEPGVILGDLERAANAVSLRFPPDPSSSPFCSIGGIVSTNAAGAHTLRYGATRRWVSALDCVFADGSRGTVARGERLPEGVAPIERFLQIADELREDERASPSVHRDVRKNSSGYALNEWAKEDDLVDLLVGGEGTLCIVVGAELMLAERPGATASLLGSFASLEDAVVAAVRARDAGAAACELLDRTFLDVARNGAATVDVPMETEAVLLAEVEGDDADDAANAARSLAMTFRECNATEVRLALSADEESRLWDLRHAASPLLAKLGADSTSMQFIEDGAVPPARLAEYVRGVRAILDGHGTRGVIFGHAGDSHVHVNPLIDTTRLGWRGTVSQILTEVVALTAKLGGTLDAEHGDGRLRTPLLSRVWSPDVMRRFSMVKQAFDPAGILNPGVKVPLRGERSIGAIKYDPTLAPLPPRAAAALARVAAERKYAAFRLDMLQEPA